MKRVQISEDAFGDLNEGFLFYESQEPGLGDYFSSCLRADIEGLKLTAGMHRRIGGFYRLLSRVFPYGVFYKTDEDRAVIIAVIDLRRNPLWIRKKLRKR
jgi:hypothetical protein